MIKSNLSISRFALEFCVPFRLHLSLAGEIPVRSLLQRPMMVCVAIATFMIWSTHAPAQNQPKPDGTGSKEAAVFEGAKGNIVQVKLGNNSWLMQLDPKVVVTFTGTAETDFVQLAQAPLMVRIKAEVHNRQKKVLEPVTEIEIINISETEKPEPSSMVSVEALPQTHLNPRDRNLKHSVTKSLVR